MCLLCYIELTSIPVNLRHVSPSSLLAMRQASWVFSIIILLLSGHIWALLFALLPGV